MPTIVREHRVQKLVQKFAAVEESLGDRKEPDMQDRRLALKSALTSRVQDSKFVVLDELKFDEIKTKNFQNVLNNLKLDKALVVMAESDENVVLSARNIQGVKTALTNTINVYDIMKYDTVVCTKDAVAKIEEVYA